MAGREERWLDDSDVEPWSKPVERCMPKELNAVNNKYVVARPEVQTIVVLWKVMSWVTTLSRRTRPSWSRPQPNPIAARRDCWPCFESGTELFTGVELTGASIYRDVDREA